MAPIHSLAFGSALSVIACTTTNPPYDSGTDAVSPDGVTQCDPSSCESGHCLNGRCAKPCADGSTCAHRETCCESTFCTDLTEDPDNCGACGTACAPRQFCSDMICSDVLP